LDEVRERASSTSDLSYPNELVGIAECVYEHPDVIPASFRIVEISKSNSRVRKKTE